MDRSFNSLSKTKIRLIFAGIFFGLLVLLGGLAAVLAWQEGGIVKASAPQSFISSTAKKISNSCKDIADWRTCYGEQIGNVNKTIVLPDTLRIIESLKEVDKRTMDCHLIAHWVSLSEVEKSPENWVNIFNYVDQTTCNNGYVHGVLEGRDKADPNFQINQKVIVDTCELIDQKTSKRLGKQGGGSDDACGHIMGHITLAENNGDIPKTVKMCEELDQNLSKSCLQGLFMENVTRENLETHQVAEKLEFTEEEANELKEVCQTFNGQAGESCWRELSHIFTIISQLDPEKSYEYCYSGTDPKFNQECYMHAVNLIVLSPGYSIKDLENTCKPYLDDPETLKICISRTISPLINSSTGFTDRAINFCGFIPLDAKGFCYSRIGYYLKPKVDLEKRLELCKRAPQRYFNLCAARPTQPQP